MRNDEIMAIFECLVYYQTFSLTLFPVLSSNILSTVHRNVIKNEYTFKKFISAYFYIKRGTVF